MNHMRLITASTLFFPLTAYADPLDKGEAYTTRQGPPEWMDNIDLTLLIIDYGIFALMLIGMGWLLFKRPHYFLKAEALLKKPFAAIFALASRSGTVTGFILQLVGGLLSFAALAAWVFFCQWLKSKGLGAFSMIGLALMALMLVRMIKGNEKPRPVS
ncbi:hypothetical protein FE236_09170 [Mariprofundus erugo]|uniref:Uncharacterized protein n=1 Tax=Mariprofundus erugo TaxID=2528639 RepID=A0A5R9GNW5_9PROT|nr:hypothetical protein [Mariprofundus erugo]TLS66133.1 hypothetical protein FEF65_11090 [Mariprofundus erugo]TLS75610.1 hypothetical protein FE236_09170 [Mariprofundus erugo]